MTPFEWIAVYRAWPPEIRREATAMIASEAGMVTMLRAARGETGERGPRDESAPRRMLSRRASRCVVCRAGITVGEPIVWQRDRGAWHARCAR